MHLIFIRRCVRYLQSDKKPGFMTVIKLIERAVTPEIVGWLAGALFFLSALLFGRKLVAGFLIKLYDLLVQSGSSYEK